jgi:hypothetical protein
MVPLRPSLGALLCLLLALLGCGRERTPAVGPAANDYFPLVEGAHWVYELRSELGSLKVEVVAKGDMPVRGRDIRVFVMDETNRGQSLGFVETAPVGYLVEHGFLARLSSLDYDRDGQLRLLGKEDVPSWFLPLNPKPGESWNQESRLFSTPEGGGARLGWRGEIQPLTSVTVPAGAFHDVLEVHIEYHDPKDANPGPNVVYDDFYVRGVGLVRSVTLDPSGDESHTIEQVLLEYSFPNGPNR